jgi:hypothetical protein
MCSMRCSSASERASRPVGAMQSCSASVAASSASISQSMSSAGAAKERSGAISVVGRAPERDELLDEAARVLEIALGEAPQRVGEVRVAEADDAARRGRVAQHGAVLQAQRGLQAIDRRVDVEPLVLRRRHGPSTSGRERRRAGMAAAYPRGAGRMLSAPAASRRTSPPRRLRGSSARRRQRRPASCARASRESARRRSSARRFARW